MSKWRFQRGKFCGKTYMAGWKMFQMFNKFNTFFLGGGSNAI